MDPKDTAPLNPPVAEFVDSHDLAIPEHALVTVSSEGVAVSMRKHEIRRGVRCAVQGKKLQLCRGDHNNAVIVMEWPSDSKETHDFVSRIAQGFHCVLTGDKPPEGVRIAWTVDEPKWIWCRYGWSV